MVADMLDYRLVIIEQIIVKVNTNSKEACNQVEVDIVVARKVITINIMALATISYITVLRVIDIIIVNIRAIINAAMVITSQKVEVVANVAPVAAINYEEVVIAVTSNYEEVVVTISVLLKELDMVAIKRPEGLDNPASIMDYSEAFIDQVVLGQDYFNQEAIISLEESILEVAFAVEEVGLNSEDDELQASNCPMATDLKVHFVRVQDKVCFICFRQVTIKVITEVARIVRADLARAINYLISE